MNEKPVLFNSEMVKAILEGCKTQTRRPFRFQPTHVQISEMYPEDNYFTFPENAPKSWREHEDIFELHPMNTESLWVRETFSELALNHLDQDYCPEYVYRATEPEWSTDMEGFRWTPSIHMPRESSRINLKVKRVWVERVQDITEEDAKSEGMRSYDLGGSKYFKRTNDAMAYRASFNKIWNSIYKNWHENPWVWCCEFEVN